MVLSIQPAREPEELRALFVTRHQVFAVEEAFLPSHASGAIVDLYDALPTTTNLCAKVHGQVVGGVRVTRDGEGGLPADDFWDFRTSLSESARLASYGRMCVLRSHRDDPRIILNLLRLSMLWAVLHERTHLCGVVNPPALALVERMGFRPVGPEFRSPEGLPSIPVAMSIDAMAPDYMAFCRRQRPGLWLEALERRLYGPGEVIVRAGEPADGALLVVEGQVLALTSSPTPVVLGAGEVFGARALVAPASHPRTVKAVTPTMVMPLPRQRFMDQLQVRPEIVGDLLRGVDRRFDAGHDVEPSSGASGVFGAASTGVGLPGLP